MQSLTGVVARAAERELAATAPAPVVQPVKKKRRKSGLLKKVEAELAAERAGAAAAAETAAPVTHSADQAGKQPAGKAPKAARASAAGNSSAGPSSEPTAASAATAAGTGRDARHHVNGAAVPADEVVLKRRKKQRKGVEGVQDLDGEGAGAAHLEVPDVHQNAGQARAGRPSSGSVTESQRPTKGEGKGGGAAAAQAALKRKITKMKAHQGVKR